MAGFEVFVLQAVNNLAVVLLSQGALKEVCSLGDVRFKIADGRTQGIEVLETALRTSPSTIVVAEPFLFNLCELFLRQIVLFD